MKEKGPFSLAGYPSRLFHTLVALLCFVSCACKGAPETSAEEILRRARLQPTSHPLTLGAEIRGGEDSLPLTFKIEKGQILYLLEAPEEKIILKLGKTETALSDTQQGKQSSLTPQDRYQEIRHTGVTYDDLSLGFLYWPHPRLVRTEQLRGTKSFVLELSPPAEEKTPYGSALLWIDQNSGAPLRMEGFDKMGKLLKRFEVLSAQKIHDLWTLKEMRIERFNPENNAVTQRCYLTVHPLSKK